MSRRSLVDRTRATFGSIFKKRSEPDVVADTSDELYYIDDEPSSPAQRAERKQSPQGEPEAVDEAEGDEIMRTDTGDGSGLSGPKAQSSEARLQAAEDAAKTEAINNLSRTKTESMFKSAVADLTTEPPPDAMKLSPYNLPTPVDKGPSPDDRTIKLTSGLSHDTDTENLDNDASSFTVGGTSSTDGTDPDNPDKVEVSRSTITVETRRDSTGDGSEEDPFVETIWGVDQVWILYDDGSEELFSESAEYIIG